MSTASSPFLARARHTPMLSRDKSVTSVKPARSIFLRRYVGPRALLPDELPDPVGIVATICQHNRLRAQSGQKHRTEPIVMGLAASKAEPHRQSVGVNDG